MISTMKKKHHTWKSPSLGREMNICVYGTSGTPVIIYPSEEGKCTEWEETGMIELLGEQLEQGYNQLFCVDSVSDESLLNKNVEPYVRVSRLKQYEQYVTDELIPFIHEQNSNPYIINTGVFLGAYYALLFALKHPEQVGKVIGLSGTYNIKPYLDGYYDDNVYYNNPVDFIPNLNENNILDKISRLDIRLLTYANDPQRNQSERMSETLWLKYLEHNFYVWDQKVSDPWDLVASMVKEHLY